MVFEREDAWKCTTLGVALLTGIFTIINWNIANLELHIKTIYIFFLIIVTMITLYLILFKTGGKKHGKNK